MSVTTYRTRAHTTVRVWPERGGFAWSVDGFRSAEGWEPDAMRAHYAAETAVDVQMEARS